ncbi:hypothetical protein BGZ51_009701 [Haplosporangium sp. Z 767]|nr:hypothetical protein BGZ51_009701 [Haplosporangium sp. Z 767]
MLWVLRHILACLDDRALSKLNIKTLKRYLTSYNISTHGMIEKQELIKAIKDNRPLLEESEVYFRQHMPDTVEKSAFFREEFSSFSRSISSENRFWDMDKFFSKLFGHEDTQPINPKPNSHSKPQPSTPPRPNSQQHTQPESQHQSMPYSQSSGSTYPKMPTPQPSSSANNYPRMPTPPLNWGFRPGSNPAYTTFNPSPFAAHSPDPSSFNGGYSQQYPPQSFQFNTAHSQHYPGYSHSSPPQQGYQQPFQHNHQQYPHFQHSQQYQYRPEQQNYQQPYPQYQQQYHHTHHQQYHQQSPPTSSFSGTTGSNSAYPNHHYPSAFYTPDGTTQAGTDAHTSHSWNPTPNPSQPFSTATSQSGPSQTEGRPGSSSQSRPNSYSGLNSHPQTPAAAPPPPSSGSRAPQNHHDYSSTDHSTSAPEPMQRSEPEPGRPRQSSRAPQTAHSTTLLTLEEIISENVDPSTLSIKVIKSLLDTNCVSYIGVIEKSDLVSCLQKLMNSSRAEQDRIAKEQEVTSKKQQDASAPSSSASQNGTGTSSDDDNLCKVCYEASLNCVMLNCNHMATCLDCGKAIMESTRVCPICREYVIKLLHVFKA